MIGRFEDKHVSLSVMLRLDNQQDIPLEFVIDTGFGGDLTLPIDQVAAFNLPYTRTMTAYLADGTDVELALHSAAILWQGSEREVDVLATGTRPLLGIGLLDGSELVVQFLEGGLVTVDEI